MIIAVTLIIASLIWLVYASANIRSGVYVKTCCRLDTNEKLLALTFDDGPDAINTPLVLDVLQKHHIPAIFFCIGKSIENNELLLQRMIAAGHLIGNHSWGHQSLLPFYSSKQLQQEITHTEQEIERAIKQKAACWFRPPFGITNPNISKAIHEKKYRTMGWNIRSFDTISSNHQSVVQRIIKKIKPGSIILLHDNLKDAPVIVEAIIKHAHQEGYTFVRADKYIKQ